MSIIDTNPHRVDVSRQLREILMRNGIQARISFNDNGKPILIVKGHDSPVLEYNLSDEQVRKLMNWGGSYQSVNKEAYNTFINIVKKDFDCPMSYVYAKNAMSSVATGLHGYRIGVGEYGNYPYYRSSWRDRLPGLSAMLGFGSRFRPEFWGGGPFHGRRIGGRYFENYVTPWVAERPDGRVKPGEMVSGGYGFYYKGNGQQNDLNNAVQNIEPHVLKPAPRDKIVEGFYSPKSCNDNPKLWNTILDSHGIVVDREKGTITIQSKALRADAVLTEKDDPDIRKKIDAIMCPKWVADSKRPVKGVNVGPEKAKKGYSVSERIFLLNGIIDSQFKDKITKKMLEDTEMIDIEAKPEYKNIIEKDFIEQDKRILAQKHKELDSNQMKYADDLYRNDIDYQRELIHNDPAAVNGREIASIMGEKGWFVNCNSGRELNVGEIRVDKVGGKYFMSADVNGEVMQKEISAKSYGKFLNYDDKHRLNMFASTFDQLKIADAAVEGGRSVYEYGNESAFRKNIGGGEPLSYEDRLAVIQGKTVDAQAIVDYAKSMGIAAIPEARIVGSKMNTDGFDVDVKSGNERKMEILAGNNYDPFNGGMTVQQRLDFLNSFDKSGGKRLNIDGLTRYTIAHQDEIARRIVVTPSTSVDELKDISEDRNIKVPEAVVEPLTQEEIKRGEVSFEQVNPERRPYSRMTDSATDYFNSNGMVQNMFLRGGNKSEVKIENVAVFPPKSPGGSYTLTADVNGMVQKRLISAEDAEKFASSDNMGKMMLACSKLDLEVVERSKIDSEVIDVINKGQAVFNKEGKPVALESVKVGKTPDGNYTMTAVVLDGNNKHAQAYNISKDEYKKFSNGNAFDKMDVLDRASGDKLSWDIILLTEKTGADSNHIQDKKNVGKDDYVSIIGNTKVSLFTDKYDGNTHHMIVAADGKEKEFAISENDFNRFVKGDDDKKREIVAKYFNGEIDMSSLSPVAKFKMNGLGEKDSVEFRKNGKDFVVQTNIGDNVVQERISEKDYAKFCAADDKGKAALLDKWMTQNSTDWKALSNKTVAADKDKKEQEKKDVAHKENKGENKSAGMANKKGSEWEGRVSDNVDGASLRDVNAKKGWYREGEGGREVSVGEIRVHTNGQDKDGNNKYTMSAVINGQVVSHEISQKQYNKFLSMDDYGRMRYFAKVFPEVDLKTLPGQKANIGKNILNALAVVGGVAAGVALGLGRPHHHHDDIEIVQQGYYKPGVGDGTILVARNVRDLAATNYDNKVDNDRPQDLDLNNSKGRGV